MVHSGAIPTSSYPSVSIMIRGLCEHENKDMQVKEFCWPCWFEMNKTKRIDWSSASATLMMEGMSYGRGEGY